MRTARIVSLVALFVVAAVAPAATAAKKPPRQYFGTSLTVGVGGGSVLTFEAPGKQAGTLAVGGFAGGFIRGKFILNKAYRVRLGYAPTALALGDLPGGRAGTVLDGPLIDACEVAGFRTGIGAKSGLTFNPDGTISGTLVLTLFNSDLGFGCADVGHQSVTVPVTGKLGVKKLARVVLDGQAAGVKLPGSVAGSVRLHLVTSFWIRDV